MKGRLSKFRADAEAARGAWAQRGTSSGSVPARWRWTCHASDLGAAVRDSRRALEWAWGRGVPRRIELGLSAGVDRLREALVELEESWSEEHDAQLGSALDDHALATDAINLLERSHPSLEELDALTNEGLPENLRELIDLARAIKALELLGSDEVPDSREAADAAILRGDGVGTLRRGVVDDLFGSSLLRGLRRRAARRGGRAWAMASTAAPPAWVSGLLESEARVRRPVAWFYAEWLIAQAKVVQDMAQAKALEGMTFEGVTFDDDPLAPLLGCARRLQRVRTAIDVTDTDWPARVIEGLQEDLRVAITLRRRTEA